MEQKTIQQYLTSSTQAEVVIDNNCGKVDNLDELNSVLNAMLNNCHAMPAFSVSLHNQTIEAMQKGVWLKLIYNSTMWLDEMNFDELLIQVNPDHTGFNVIRGNKGIYEGRCYYIDLVGNDMSELYNYLRLNFK